MISSEPLVSVLYPVYNVARYVDDAIASVVAQRYENWELVACDDASSDGTLTRIETLAANEPRIRILRNPGNVGMTANWNRALAAARGELVMKLDGDDAYQPETIGRLLDAMRSDDLVGAGVRTLVTDENLHPLDGLPADDGMMRAGVDPYSDQTRSTDEWRAIAIHGVQLWHSCAFMTRLETMRSLNGFDERFGCASDTELILRLLSIEGRFRHLAYPGVLYRRVAGSVSDRARREGWLRWESVNIHLAAIAAIAKSRRLSGAEWQRYVDLWQERALLLREPGLDTLRERCASYSGNVAPPPWWRRAARNLRAAAARTVRKFARI